MAEDSRDDDGRAVAAASLPIPAPRADRSIAPADTLGAYMAELRRYPPISREQEHELAVRWFEHGDRSPPRTTQSQNSHCRKVRRLRPESR